MTGSRHKKRSLTEIVSSTTSIHDDGRQKNEKKNVKKQKKKQHQPQKNYPYRKIHHNLFTPLPTLRCATKIGCIPCVYKIAAFDIALDTEFTQRVPNLRPELCPRSASSTNTDDDDGVVETTTTTKTTYENYSYGYNQSGIKILTIGDGDFSFSLALARILRSDDDKKASSQLTATSYESPDTLKKVYPDIQTTSDELKELNVELCYKVDATNLRDTLPSSESTNKLHRIVWNFPCTAIANGQDGQNQEMQENRRLVKDFIKECAGEGGRLHPEVGEIHFLHKTKPPYDQWGLERICDDDDLLRIYPEGSRLEYKGRVVFDKCLLLPYTPRKALDKKSFPCHDACLYVFGWKKINADDATASDIIATIPPSSEHKQNDNDQIQSSPEEGGAFGIVPVTENLIDNIRVIHLQLGSYQERKQEKKMKKKPNNKRRRRK